MRQIGKIVSVITILLLINLTFLSIISTQAVRAQEDEDDPQKKVLQRTIFFMRKGKELHPESPEPENQPLQISCPAKTEPYHPILPGKYIRFFVWNTVPFNFESNRVNSPIMMGHRVLFKLHFTATQENLGSIRFIFTLLQSNNRIAVSEEATYSNLDKDEDGYVTISAGINITGNRLNVGDTLDMHIDYWVNGDGLKIKYDNPIYDSGLEIDMNPIKIQHIHPTPNSLRTVFHEAFNVRLTKLNILTTIDQVPMADLPLFSMTKEGRTATWDVNLKEGAHTVEVRMSYGGNENETMVVMILDFRIVIDRPPTLFGLTYNYWFLMIGLVIVFSIVGIIYKTIRSRRDEEELMELMGRR